MSFLPPIAPPVACSPADFDVAELLKRADVCDSRAQGAILQSLRDFMKTAATELLDQKLRAKLSGSDIVQESLLDASQSFGQFRGVTVREFKSWLLEILRHNVADARRWFASAKRDIEREEPLVPGEGVLNAVRLDASRPEDVVCLEEQRRTVDAAINQLGPTQQTIIRLHHHESRTFREIADVLKITENAARKTWARAVEELRQILRIDFA